MQISSTPPDAGYGRRMVAHGWHEAQSTGLSWGNIIALAALGLSILSLATQWVRLTAKVSVSVEREYEPPQSWFVFENHGRAVAREVNLSFDHFEEERRKPNFISSGPTLPLPLGYLRPWATVRVPVHLVIGVGETFDVEVSWKDRRPWKVRRMVTV